MASDHYKTLGVSPNATPSEIKEAYRKLAKLHHPDRNKGKKSAEEKFKEIKNAYDVLSDALERAAYDRKNSKTSTHENTQTKGSQTTNNYQKPEEPSKTKENKSPSDKWRILKIANRHPIITLVIISWAVDTISKLNTSEEILITGFVVGFALIGLPVYLTVRRKYKAQILSTFHLVAECIKKRDHSAIKPLLYTIAKEIYGKIIEIIIRLLGALAIGLFAVSTIILVAAIANLNSSKVDMLPTIEASGFFSIICGIYFAKFCWSDLMRHFTPKDISFAKRFSVPLIIILIIIIETAHNTTQNSSQSATNNKIFNFTENPNANRRDLHSVAFGRSTCNTKEKGDPNSAIDLIDSALAILPEIPIKDEIYLEKVDSAYKAKGSENLFVTLTENQYYYLWEYRRRLNDLRDRFSQILNHDSVAYDVADEIHEMAILVPGIVMAYRAYDDFSNHAWKNNTTPKFGLSGNYLSRLDLYMADLIYIPQNYITCLSGWPDKIISDITLNKK